MASGRKNNNNIFCTTRSMPAVVGACCLIHAGIVSANGNGNGYADNEIAVFRFTGFEGHVALHFREDEQVIASGGTSSTDKRTSFEEEIFVLSHSYVYHPKFLKMDLGFGPVLEQSTLETGSGKSESDTVDYNILARLSFLEEKPYPLFVYYEKDHASAELTLTDTFQQENEKYGFDFKLKQPLLPFELSIGASQHKTKGDGLVFYIDDIIDQRIVRADIPMGTDGYGTMTYTENDLVSKSGLQLQPTQTTKISTDTTSFDSRVYMGDKNEYQLSNYLTYVEQSGVRPLKELRYTPELRYTHSEDLLSFYRLNYLDSDQETVQATIYGATSGFRYAVSDRTNIDAEIHAENNETTGLMQDNYGISGKISHKRDYSFGKLSLSGGWNYNYYDREKTDNVAVRDLILNFVGTIPQFLPNDNIIQATIVATRILNDGSEVPLSNVGTTCTPLFDIAIITIGARTQVQICNVTAGEDIQVSFDYEYDPGDTATYSNFVQSYQANFLFQRYSNFYARFSDSSSDISSGTTTIPLTESRNSQFGARIDYPLFETISLGGEVVYEEEDGTSISYTRDTVDGYIQFGLFNGTARIGSHQVRIDYFNSSEDIDLVRHSVQFRVRPWNRFNLTADISDEEDTGGSIYRRTKIKSLNAEWRVRKLVLLAEARYIDEVFGDSIRERSLIRISLRRDF